MLFRSEITEARGDDDVFPSSSFLREYVPLEGCELHNTMLAQRHKVLTLFSDEPHRNLKERIRNSIGGSRGHHKLGAHIHHSIGGSQEHHYAVWGQRPKSNMSTNFHFHKSRGESKPMQLMQMARAQVLKSFTLKHHTNQQMLMG